ncbi:MAG: hypothetical protein QM530_08020 [Phycisphaerales bacterium]|nr:hypothetical protein [Phycisphaerales bacterium]
MRSVEPIGVMVYLIKWKGMKYRLKYSLNVMIVVLLLRVIW